MYCPILFTDLYLLLCCTYSCSYHCFTGNRNNRHLYPQSCVLRVTEERRNGPGRQHWLLDSPQRKLPDICGTTNSSDADQCHFQDGTTSKRVLPASRGFLWGGTAHEASIFCVDDHEDQVGKPVGIPTHQSRYVGRTDAGILSTDDHEDQVGKPVGIPTHQSRYVGRADAGILCVLMTTRPR